MTKKLLFWIVFCTAVYSVWAQNDVTLVVSGEGRDKNEATFNALRSAIEQTCGTFISANTSVLNDQLVTDEVVSLSSGNITNYEYVSETTQPNGNLYVTVKATVSVDKLTTFCESRGMVAELKGAAFAMNIKKLEFDKIAEEKAMENLYRQLVSMLPFLFEYQVTLEEPTLTNIIINELGIYGDDPQIKPQLTKRGYTINDKHSLIQQVVHITPKKDINLSMFLDVLSKNLSAISLQESRIPNYNKYNYPFFKLDDYFDRNHLPDNLYFRSWNSISIIIYIHEAIEKYFYNILVSDDLHEFEIFWDNIVDDIVEIPLFNVNGVFFRPSWLLGHHGERLNSYNEDLYFSSLLRDYEIDYPERGKSILNNYSNQTGVVIEYISAKLLSGLTSNHPLLSIPKFRKFRRVWPSMFDPRLYYDYLQYYYHVIRSGNKPLLNSHLDIFKDKKPGEIPPNYIGTSTEDLLPDELSNLSLTVAMYYTVDEFSKITFISVNKPTYTEDKQNSTVSQGSKKTSSNTTEKDHKRSLFFVYSDTLQQAVYSYNALLKYYPYNYQEKRISYSLPQEYAEQDGLLRDTLHVLLDIISEKTKQLKEQYKTDSLEYHQLNGQYQQKLEEVNQELLEYPYNVEKKTITDVLPITLFGKSKELKEEMQKRLRSLPEKQEQIEQEVRSEIRSNNPQQYVSIYYSHFANKKAEADSMFLECRCNFPDRFNFDLAFVDNTLNSCTCRQFKYDEVKHLFHSREEFDQSYNQPEEVFNQEIAERRRMMDYKTNVEETLLNSKQLNFKKARNSSNEEMKMLLRKIDVHKGKYYYTDVIELIFVYNERLAKEWTKNGNYFKSKAEMFEYYIGEDYDKELKERKKE